MRTSMIGRCCLFLLCLGLANLNLLFVVNAEEPDMDEVLPVASDINEGVDVVVTSDEVGTVEPTPLLCESFHYDCYNCITNGCYWCTYDSLCFSTPEFVSEKTPSDEKVFPNKAYSCKTEEDFTHIDTQETCSAPDNVFSDPMYGGQNWIFKMIKVEPVWQRGYFGNGVRVRVNDGGIESSHPEFAGRIDFSASCDEDMGGVEPFPPLIQPGSKLNKHGTVVASLVGAAGNNSECGVGIAPQVTLSSCNNGGFMSFPELLTYKLDQMDISQNSWAFEGCGKNSNLDPERSLQDSGVQTVVPTLTTECPFVYKPFDGYSKFPCEKCTLFQNSVDVDNDIEIGLLGEDCVNSVVEHCEYFYTQEEKTCVEYLDLILEKKAPSSGGECKFKNIKDAGQNALSRGVTEGRDGKGIIYVFAAGNENRYGDDTNFQSYGASTRFTIPVASVGKKGLFADSSTPGASVFIAAPGGDPRQSHTTVIAAVNGGKCSDAGDGTSYAAPVVSGVVALMLEANPDLGWRDVQDILARSAQFEIDPEDPTFDVNSAGLSHSNKYGFGIVNADLAVNMSITHTNLGPERMLLGRGSADVPIFDHSEGLMSVANVTIDSGLPFVAESVVVYLRLNHTSRGHLKIELKSPGGMVSLLTPGFRPEDQTDEWMKLTTVRHRGENPNGEWSIKISDTVQGDVNSCSGKSQWQWQLTDDFSNNTVDEVLHCEFNLDFLLRRFCTDGQIDRENGYYGLLCNDGIDEACELLDKFETDSYDGLKVTDACCICGGGALPSSFPDYLFEWKVEVYGSNHFTDFFSIDRDNVEFGRGGLRGRTDELRMQADELESFTDGGPLSEVFDVGPLSEVQLCKSISDTICQLPYMAGLCDAITRTGLNETLSELAISEWTIFAPTNDAFESDPNVSLREGDDLSDVLLYHFVLGRKLFKTDLYCNATITMSNDDDSVTICEDDAPLYQKGLGNQDDRLPMIIKSDIEMCNGGIIHLVDNLLMLPTVA